MTAGRVLSLVCAAALMGCAPGGGHGARGPLRPAAATRAQDEIELLLAPTFESLSADDDVVRVVGPYTTCTGTLLAEDMVLTARHCVVQRGSRGEFTPALVDAPSLQVELGGDFLPWGAVGLKAVIAPPCGEAGGRGDVALLVLQRRLVGAKTRALRQEPPRAGEIVDAVGFGRCALSSEGIRRRLREAGPIDQVSPGAFEVQASVCPGDSGGPAFDRAGGRVVGVVSLSAMDHDETTLGKSVFARVDDVAPLVAYARRLADGIDPGTRPGPGCGQ